MAGKDDRRTRHRTQRSFALVNKLRETQPYHVAEAFTGLPGEDVPLARTIADVEEIVAGRHDGLAERFFAYTGTLGDVLAKARAAETGKRSSIDCRAGVACPGHAGLRHSVVWGLSST